MRKILLLWLVLMASALNLQAQEKEYMYEIGMGGGMSWAYGDINRSSLIYEPSGAAELLFRYNANLRWSIAIDLSSNGLKGDTRDFDNQFPHPGQYTADACYWQLGIRPEFTFWNYGWGADYREKHRLAPFLTAGVGFGYCTGNEKDCGALSLPLGIGLKWKMAPRWDLQLTSLWAKTFSDGLDGVTDPYNIGTTVPMNTDWVSSIMLSVTFCFKERCIECHNQKN